MGDRAIARKIGCDVKTVRRALGRSNPGPIPSKIEPFIARLREMAMRDLTVPRILRELRSIGYTGGKTILAKRVRSIRGSRKLPIRVFRRFETPPGEEGQADWSPYRIRIAGRETRVHCFSMILAWSRFLWIGFYRDERLPSLLHAHAEAFAAFGGCPRTVVYDNMTTVTLGRSAGKPIWNPAFLDFARHYGFTPRVCRPRDPNRKGKIERPFSWIDADLLRGTEFASHDEFRSKTRDWLDSVANVRVHSTTKRVPAEALLEERACLIRLPEVASPAVARSEVRKVASDGTVCVDGSFYPVPAALVGQCVSVRVYPDRIEVLDASGTVVAAHRIPDVPGRVSIDGPGAAPPRREPVPRGALEARFLTLFPDATVFLDGLLRRMKGLAAIHFKRLDRLVELYGEKSVREAVERATRYRNFSSDAIGRILEAGHPNLFETPPVPHLTGHPSVLAALDDIPVADLSEYTLDSMPPTPPAPDPEKGTSDDDDRPW